MNKEEKMKVIYTEAEKFLYDITPIEIRGNKLGKYFDVGKKFKFKDEIFFRLLGSLQNKQMATNVIGFWKDNRSPVFKEILLDYDSDAILMEYKSDADLLFESFKKYFSIKNADSDRNLWRMYAKAVISACKFLSKFKDATDFDNFVMRFSYNAFSSAALPMLLEKEIYGLGFALACDFLKELGYTEYPKPDVHIKDIFAKFDLCEHNDYSAYKAVIEMARVVNETPYKVDKIFWLIGSGNYYLDKNNKEDKKGKKKEFIEKMNFILKKIMNEPLKILKA